jgi:hypothetical protein
VDVGDGLGDGLLLGLGLVDGLLLGLGLVLGDGERVLPGLGDSLLGLGFGLVLIVRTGVGLALGDGELLLLTWCAFPDMPDTDAASAIPLPCRALGAEANLTAVAGRVAHDRFPASAAVTCVPTKRPLTRPHETTAVPAHAPNVADPARRVPTIPASPRSMPPSGTSLVTISHHTMLATQMGIPLCPDSTPRRARARYA